MDADQKLTELKKAYAEVLLNTAKEAAARIMASERKVFRLEIELKQSKEIALQMLLRLKQMMDAKTSEAEMVSQAQQKRIEELEAQLQEAEDIVTDLREELSAVHGEKARPPQKGSSIFPNPDKEKSNNGHILYNFLFPTLKSCINDKDLPAIILRGKGTKRNRSECTQRIHECEQTAVDKKGQSTMNEEKESGKRASPNKKRRTLGPKQPLDQVTDMDHVSIPEKPKEEGINVVAGLISVSDAFGRLREDLVRPHTPIREELLPMGREKPEMPLLSEIHVGQSIALVTGSSRVIKHTFQRKRKQGTDGSNLSNKLTKNEENKNAGREPEKVISVERSSQDSEEVISVEESTQEEIEQVISMDESTQEEIEKVISMEKSTQETEKVITTEGSTEEENLELVAHQLISLSEQESKVSGN